MSFIENFVHSGAEFQTFLESLCFQDRKCYGIGIPKWEFFSWVEKA